jgi:hypothetical protein
MTNVPALDRTSVQDVFPPYRSVCGPGVAIDPRVPKKRTRIALALLYSHTDNLPVVLAVRS